MARAAPGRREQQHSTIEIQSLVAPCFSSNMVLQSASDRTSIYSHANSTVGGDTVSVTITPAAIVDGRGPFQATAAADGSWIVKIGKMAVVCSQGVFPDHQPVCREREAWVLGVPLDLRLVSSVILSVRFAKILRLILRLLCVDQLASGCCCQHLNCIQLATLQSTIDTI